MKDLVILGVPILLLAVRPRFFAQTAAPLHQLAAEISEKGKKKGTISSKCWEGECQREPLMDATMTGGD